MGHDYSYSQPDSSDQYDRVTDDTEDREIQALILQDEAESSFNQTHPIHCPPQPEVEFGFPKVCYCGGTPVLETCYTRNDPGRRFYTCENVHAEEMHIHKWWDVALMEEMRERDKLYQIVSEKVDFLTLQSDYDSHINQVRDLSNGTEQKLIHLEKVVSELAKKKSRFGNGYELVVAAMATVLVVIAIVVRLF